MCVLHHFFFLTLLKLIFYMDLSWTDNLEKVQLNGSSVLKNSLKIIGGVEVKEHTIPYQAALIINGGYFCGGAIISARYVLTVAHCTYNARRVQAILGAHKWKSREATQQIYTSTNIINHNNFNINNGLQGNDISLIKIGPIFLTHHIRPIKLVDSHRGDFIGDQAALSGWGKTSDRSDVSSSLRRVYLTVASNNYCQRFYHGIIIKPTHICTKEKDAFFGLVGGCYGDSGGPLVKNNELIGILSFGDTNCQSGKPSIFTRITAYREWIRIHSGV